jgi:hypothetical protein
MDPEQVIEATRRWIAAVVIGLNLCPFARRVFAADLIRYVVSDAQDEGGLLQDLADEVKALAASPAAAVETTLLIHPRVLGAFPDYNDFLGAAERLVAGLGQRGVIQLASFHPGYQFAGAAPGAAANYTNRSPYPMLHLLREQSITAVAADPGELLDIPRRNVETLRRLGLEKIRKMLKAIEGGSGPGA